MNGFAERWSWFEATWCLPWLRGRGESRASLRALARALELKPQRMLKWRKGSIADRFELERIAEVVGVPDSARAAAWLVTGVGERPERSPAQLDDRADPRRVSEQAQAPDLDAAMDRLARAAQETSLAGLGVQLPEPIVQKVAQLVRAAIDARDLYSKRRALAMLVAFLLTSLPFGADASESVATRNQHDNSVPVELQIRHSPVQIRVPPILLTLLTEAFVALLALERRERPAHAEAA